MELNSELKQHVEATVGRSLPNEPHGEAFDLFLGDLARRDPSLYRTAVEELYGRGATPAEAQAARIARRERTRALVTRLFYHPNARGLLVVDKRKTGLLIGLAILLTTAAVYLLATRLSVPTVLEAAGEQGAVETVAVPEPRPEVTILTRLPDPANAPSRRFEPERASRPAAFTPSPVAVSPPPSRPTTYGTQPPTLSTTPSASSETFTEMPLPTTMSLVQDTAQPDDPPSSMSLARQAGRSSAAPNVLSSQSSLNRPLGAPAASPTSTLSMAVERATPPERMRTADPEGGSQGSVGLTLETVSREATPPLQPSSLSTASATAGEVPFTADASRARGALSASTGPTRALTDLPAARLLDTGQDPSSAPANAPNPTTFLNALLPGARLPSTLVTGVAVTEGTTSPVVAETRGDWCGRGACPPITWVGEASLVGVDRVGLTFTQASVGDRAERVTAAAFGSDNLPGVAAEVSDQTPAAAQDLLRAAAGGVARYVEVLSDQQTVRTDGESTIIEDRVPGVESFILGQVAGLFGAPDEHTTVVRVARVPEGTPVTLLYGVGTGD